MKSWCQENVPNRDVQASSKFESFLKSSAYQISSTNTAIGMPPNFVNGRLHPGFSLGLQRSFSEITKKNYWDYSAHLGYFAIPSLQRALFLKPGIGYTLPIHKKIGLRPNVNSSFMLVSQINNEFQYVGSGQYEQVNKNRIQIMPSFGLEAFVLINRTKHFKYDALFGYEFGVQLPFSELSSILPLNQLKMGLRFKKIN